MNVNEEAILHQILKEIKYLSLMNSYTFDKTYNFDNTCKEPNKTFSIGNTNLRIPNNKEKRDWLINVLRAIKPYITTAQYRTVKGQIKKCHDEEFNVPISFISKFLKNIRDNFNSYCKSKCILECKCVLKPSNVVNKVIVDISLK